MKKAFPYVEFENRFRGESADVKAEQEKYLRYFIGKETVLDIGCGRGEFLELLIKNNVTNALGVEINDDMFELCKKKGLNVFKDDAISYLGKIEDQSIDGIFISHVVEHMKPDYLMELITLIHGKLKKGCYIISETLNPQCLFSIGPYFMDPTHIFPVHPHTFRFLLEANGFRNIEFVSRQYLPDDFLKLNQIDINKERLTQIEEAYSKTVSKLQTIIDLVFMNFIYSIIAMK